MATTEKILIVDDNVETLRLIGLVLRRQGYQVLAARDGFQALAMAERERPDLILLDVMMPGMDGVEVTRRLRAETTTASIPILMFTAKSGLEDELKGFQVGADDYLTKLASPPELLARVKALLSRASKSQRGRLIGVLAARGGLGVSTVTLNLGLALHQQSKEEVIVADFRPGQSTIAQSLGYRDMGGIGRLLGMPVGGITQSAVQNELMRHKTGLQLLLSSFDPADVQKIVNAQHFKAVTQALPELARYTVVDLGTGLSPIMAEVLSFFDLFVLVLEPNPNTAAQTQALARALQAQGVGTGRITYMMVNRGGNSIQPSWRQIEEDLGQELLVVVTPAAEMAFQADNNKLPMIAMQPESTTAEQYNRLAAEVLKHTGAAV